MLQPAGLIPGAVLVLLNLAFVYPEAVARKVGFVTEFAGLGGGWQIVVIASLILIIGYLLLSGSSFVLDTLSGRTWSGSVFELASRAVRDERRERLSERIRRGEFGTEAPERAMWRKRTRYAPDGVDSSPTALGDVLLAASANVEARYGMRLAALWEPLRAVVDPEKPAAEAVADEKSSLDLMANLTFVFSLFAFEAAVLYSIWDRDESVLLSLLGLLVAYVSLRITVTKAVSWCDSIDTVIALYRDDLLKELGARQAVDAEDQKRLLAGLSNFMLFAESGATLFKAESPEPTLLCSANVTAELDSAVVCSPADGAAAPEQRESIQYVLVATRKADGWTPVSAQIVLADYRLPRIREAPTASGGHTAEVVKADGRSASDALLWHLSEIKRSDAVTLVFTLDVWRVNVDNGLQVSVTLKAERYLIEVTNPTGAQVSDASLELFHAEDGPSQLVMIGGDNALLAETGGARNRVWKLNPITADGSVRFAFKLVPTEDEDS